MKEKELKYNRKIAELTSMFLFGLLANSIVNTTRTPTNEIVAKAKEIATEFYKQLDIEKLEPQPDDDDDGFRNYYGNDAQLEQVANQRGFTLVKKEGTEQ